MSQYMGYDGISLEFLKKHMVVVGDSVRVEADTTHVGIIMPRYEHADDKHIVLKLASGYNVGLEILGIKKIVKLDIQTPRVKMQEKQAHVNGLSKILLLSTGGTIASKVDYRTGAVTPILTAEELNASVPELSKIANIDTEEVLSEYSENIMPKHWMRIAEKINNNVKSGYAGIIVAHGTDTMHYTSAFLSFALAGISIPVLLVGSQRSSDRASSDAALNLIGAARLIIHGIQGGIYVAMHQDTSDDVIACHIGTRVRKNHTSKRGAFQTVGNKPAYIITDNNIQENFQGPFFKTDTFTPSIKLDSRVALVKYHPGFDPKMLDWIVEAGYRGVIFEGTGLGHIGDITHESVKRAKDRGLFLGMTSQCIDGRVRMTVYESGRDLLNMGITPLEDMLPEVALVKAMWVFGKCDNAKEAEIAMLEDIASEMSH